MIIRVAKDSPSLGRAAAAEAAAVLRAAMQRDGAARVALSTGQSQFDFFEAFVRQDVDWSRVEMFHLDEYVGLPQTHPASFRRYLRERFVEKTGLSRAHFVDGEPENIAELSREMRRAPIHLGLIGIGRNAHIAFNDPPADFDTDEAYIVVNLNSACKRQQVAEGWFADEDSVPKQAVSMTPRQILRCETILSVVPHAEKAEAVRDTLRGETTNLVPATLLKGHPRFALYLDEASASLADLDRVWLPAGATLAVERV